MIYFLVLILLFVLELAYFKVAAIFNIVDKPNLRSSHSTVTLRGGGIIFYLGILLYSIYSGFSYPFFFAGLTAMCIVSFLDDMFTLSNKLRLLVHFVSVFLMVYELQLLTMPWFFLVIGFVVIVGVINAYNFMDGINGITVAYSLAITGLLLYVNQTIGFIQQDFLIYTLLALLVFGFFNFRMRARCFAGDVGSVAIAYILLFAIGQLIFTTGNFIYILFLVVYGVDAIWTILRRLYLKENIFEAHRSHLYQYLANEAGVNKLLVSSMYAICQALVGMAVIYYATQDQQTQIVFSVLLIAGLSAVYLVVKANIIKRFLS